MMVDGGLGGWELVARGGLRGTQSTTMMPKLQRVTDSANKSLEEHFE